MAFTVDKRLELAVVSKPKSNDQQDRGTPLRKEVP